MKVRAHLAEDSDRLIPSRESERSIQLDSEDPADIDQIIQLFFDGEILHLGKFSREEEVRDHMAEQELPFHRITFNGPGHYCYWRVAVRLEILPAHALLTRELGFYFALDRHLVDEGPRPFADRKAEKVGK